MTILGEAKVRATSQKGLIISMLKRAGAEGVTNIEFARVANCYGARLSELYSVGYEIDTEYISDGVYKYILVSEPERPVKPKTKVEELVGAIGKDKINIEELDELLVNLDINVRRKSLPNLK